MLVSDRKGTGLEGTIWQSKSGSFYFVHLFCCIDNYEGWEVWQDGDTWKLVDTDLSGSGLMQTCTQLSPSSPQWAAANEAFTQAFAYAQSKLDKRRTIYQTALIQGLS